MNGMGSAWERHSMWKVAFRFPEGKTCELTEELGGWNSLFNFIILMHVQHAIP
jgi:hypothetical protein